MNWETIDWEALERLRAVFLAGGTGGPDYWRIPEDVASYDLTFAQRIGWKWDYVLAELSRRGWSPPGGEVLDWGCGSGIAHRAMLGHFGRDAAASLRLWDRSELAMRYAAGRARSKYPGLSVVCEPGGNPATVLLSHVLTELEPKPLADLLESLAGVTAVLWVEPGTYEGSRRLIAVRERLRDRFNVVAPCTHQAACGLLAPANRPHWCHHFAAPPPAVFRDANWARFGRLAGVDLRSLPVSFLVLDRRPVPTLPAGATRVIGRPRVYNAHALLLGCDAAGVAEGRLEKRRLPEAFRQIKQDRVDPLQIWARDGNEVVSVGPI
jgi:hypothetical protein